MARPDWIAVDWGTSRLRVWAMEESGSVLAENGSDQGMGRLSPEGYEPALLSLCGDWLGTSARVPVLVCGMAGSRQGWAEAPYRSVPAPPLDDHLARVETEDERIDVYIVPGMRQDSPADVMRGEETQIAGFLARRPDFDGVLCMPGTHTKWVRISAGEVVGFQTYLTGDLFQAVRSGTVLRHSVADAGWDDDAFGAAVDEGLSHPDRLAARLFSLRAENLLHGLDPVLARARLSGLLIGAELAGARPYWLGQRVAILGASEPAEAYRVALARQGAPVETADGVETVLDGLRAALGAMTERSG